MVPVYLGPERRNTRGVSAPTLADEGTALPHARTATRAGEH